MGASFQLALLRQDEILSPQELPASDPQLVPSQGHLNCGLQVFPCGCEFSTCTSPTRWKSCRHKRYRHLILNWFRTGGGDLIGRRRGIQRQGETDWQKSLWIENAARHRNRAVSPDGVRTYLSRKYPADSAEEPSSEGSFRGQFQPMGKRAPKLQKPSSQAVDKQLFRPYDAVSSEQHSDKPEVCKWKKVRDDFFHGEHGELEVADAHRHSRAEGPAVERHPTASRVRKRWLPTSPTATVGRV